MTSALAQKAQPQAGRTQLGVNLDLPSLNNTCVDVIVLALSDLVKFGPSASINLPPALVLPAVGVKVDVNTAAPAPIGVGVSLGSSQGVGTSPAIPPTPETTAAAMAGAQLAEKTIELLPTC